MRETIGRNRVILQVEAFEKNEGPWNRLFEEAIEKVANQRPGCRRIGVT